LVAFAIPTYLISALTVQGKRASYFAILSALTVQGKRAS
jgi:hypothetical protein